MQLILSTLSLPALPRSIHLLRGRLIHATRYVGFDPATSPAILCGVRLASPSCLNSTNNTATTVS